MPTISSNTLFHFTRNRQVLCKILSEGFKVQYCWEDYSAFRDRFQGSAKQRVAFPIVCFCDLPLSQASAHMKTYGSYGVGLTKEWGKSNGLTPLIYAHSKTTLVKDLPRLLRYLDDKNTSKDKDISNHIIRFMCTLKPHQGAFFRRKKIKKVQFYDEREWRYIPEHIADLGFLKDISFDDPDDALNAANLAVDHLRLTFQPKDITYIIVRSESDIPPMLDFIEHTNAKHYSNNENRLLVTRIISADRIAHDF